MLFTAILIFLLHITNGANDFCPSSTWVSCATKNGLCTIPSTINHTTISYGAINEGANKGGGQWVFAQISNTRGIEFQIKCSDDNFGDVYPGLLTNEGCCYVADNSDSYVNSMGPSTNENNWKLIAPKGKKFIADPMTYIKYGACDEFGSMYVYRWMQGEFECSSSWFGAPKFWSKAEIACSLLQAATNFTQPVFIPCGSSSSPDGCNMDVTGSVQSVSLIQYGEYPNYVYRYGYSNNNNDHIPCGNNLFGNPNPNQPFMTQFCSVSNDTSFTGAVGLWQVAESCAGQNCIIDTDIEYGVSDSNTKSHDASWQAGISQTIGGGFTMIIKEEQANEQIDVNYALTTEASMQVSNQVSNAYTQSVSKTCGAKCGNGTAADWTLYQWQFRMAEYIGVNLQPFQIYACYYVCSTSKTQPQCPPTYCKPGTDCTQCQGWSPNSTIV